MCVCVLFIYTISISMIFVSQIEPKLIASNQQINAFYKCIIFEKTGHCGKSFFIKLFNVIKVAAVRT